jgi:hypothetical protein
MTQERDAIYNRAMAAETAWARELRRVFGRDACNARYETRGKGTPGGALHATWQERDAAMRALHDYWDSRRMIRA